MFDLIGQNFISPTTIRDITTLRQDFLSALSSLGFVTSGNAKEVSKLSVNKTNDNLVKAIIVGGLYPRIARIALPKAQFERVQQGTIQKDVSQSLQSQLTIARSERGQDV